MNFEVDAFERRDRLGAGLVHSDDADAPKDDVVSRASECRGRGTWRGGGRLVFGCDVVHRLPPLNFWAIRRTAPMSARVPVRWTVSSSSEPLVLAAGPTTLPAPRNVVAPLSPSTGPVPSSRGLMTISSSIISSRTLPLMFSLSRYSR